MMNGTVPSAEAYAIVVSACKSSGNVIHLLRLSFIMDSAYISLPVSDKDDVELFAYFRKKRGQQPTGILVHAAKRTGFSSVSEMLKLGSPSKVIQDVDQSPNKPCASIKV